MVVSREPMEEGWPFLALTCRDGGEEEAEEWLLFHLFQEGAENGYLGLRMEPVSDGLVRLILSFSAAATRDRGRRRLKRALDAAFRAPPGDLKMAGEGLEPPIDWVNRVEATVHPVPLGEWYAALPGKASPLAGRRGIRVPRGCAFGTGEHPSTKLAAALLERWVQPGEPVLDLGTGTGLLAALAVLQGGTPVLALDADSQAVQAAALTRSQNSLHYQVVRGSLDCLAARSLFRVVVANIARDALLNLMPGLAQVTAPGGHLILSGVLTEQVEEMVAAAGRYGLVWRGTRADGDWGAIHLCARPAARPRVVVSGPIRSAGVRLSPSDAHHLLRVRRVRPGDPVEVVDGGGRAWTGVLTGGGKEPQVTELKEMTMATETSLAVELWQAVPHQAGRFEAIVRAATELGIRRIVPVISERCQGSRALQRRSLERWRRVALESTRQCGRNQLPDLDA
ncbi:MAG: RsmE family RNA methyltransferase, partial [Acidobacteriota bacterium]